MSRCSVSIYLLLTLLFFAACGKKRPEGVLSEKQLEHVLYDYHLMQGLVAQHRDSSSIYNNLYTKAVFDKHRITRETFDSSMVWYMTNTDDLYDIYDRLEERLEKELKETKQMAGMHRGNSDKDTLSLWSGKQHYLLSNALGTNRLRFTLHTDSTYREDDQIIWRFTTRWMTGEGKNRAIAMMAVYYDNDSVATKISTLYRTNKETLSLKLGKRPVKKIKGFVYQSATWSEKAKFIELSDISLSRIRKKKEEIVAPADSLQVDSLVTTRKDAKKL